MGTTNYDTIIIGAGLLGASTAAALSKSGQKVLVLEAHEKHHAMGSSHGRTRITRRLNFESPAFNETAAASLEAMRAMGSVAGAIVCEMPAIFIARKNSTAHRLLHKSMAAAGHKVEEITAEKIAAFGLHVAGDQIGIVDRSAATFDPSQVLDRLYAEILMRRGTIRFKTPVAKWESSNDGVKVETADAFLLHAKQLVIATGAWTPEILKKGNADAAVAQSLADAMMIKRVPLFFFDYPDQMRDVIAVTLQDDGNVELYAMPEIQPDGAKLLKAGFHQARPIGGPDTADRTVSEAEKAASAACMAKLTGRKITLRSTSTCLYTMTKDKELPLVGSLPGTPNVFVCAAGNGVSAKHAIALGRALSCLLQGKAAPYDMSPFSLTRLAGVGSV